MKFNFVLDHKNISFKKDSWESFRKVMLRLLLGKHKICIFNLTILQGSDPNGPQRLGSGFESELVQVHNCTAITFLNKFRLSFMTL
jgi:hypothetical protein